MKAQIRGILQPVYTAPKDRKTGEAKESSGSMVDMPHRSEQRRSLFMHLNPKDGARNKTAYVHATGKNAKEAKTPAYPGTCLRCTSEEEVVVKTTEYQSFVSKLMYYMTKVVLEIANAVRELAGQIIKPNGAHWKVVDQIVGYVLNELYQSLTFQEPKNLKPYIYADMDYAKDEDDRKSIVGQISTLGGMLVGWNSKKQHTVS